MTNAYFVIFRQASNSVQGPNASGSSPVTRVDIFRKDETDAGRRSLRPRVLRGRVWPSRGLGQQDAPESSKSTANCRTRPDCKREGEGFK